jgi:hypothetical protein
MRHRHVNNRHTFGMLLNSCVKGALTTNEKDGGPEQAGTKECVSVETAKRRHAMKHGVPSTYWRLRHHHGYVMARPV